MVAIFKSLAVKAIKGLLWLIDPDHRIKHEIAMDDMKKFTHVQEESFSSDFGHVDKVFRTVPYELWELKTPTKRLLAADKHRVIREDFTEAWLEDLQPGDLIHTETGLEPVVSSRSLGIRTHMYCVSVSTEDPTDKMNHLYYSDGILSHNTTSTGAYLLWKAMFEPDTTILITANKMNQALEIMDRIRFSYENLEDYNWLRAGVVEYNKGTVTFDNGSKIVARATTKDAGRGLSISLLYCDEFAFVPPNIAAEFWGAIQPTLSTGGSCIITSTPNNDEDQFAQIWHGANQTIDEFGDEIPNGVGVNGFKAIKVTWDKHPDRDEEWAKKFRSILGDAKFKREFECEFVTEDETLIDALTLSSLTGIDEEFKIDKVRWYEEPKANHTYVVGLDPSLGTGGDYAAIQVLELPTMTQIAEWRHNKTPTRDQIKILLKTLQYIDYALREDPDQVSDPEIFWTVENNSLGEAALVIIDDTGEENFPGVFVSEPKKSGGKRHRKGLNTTNRSKLFACSRLKSYIESRRLTVKSKALIRELKNFVASGNSFKAKWGETDDLIMALILCLRLAQIIVNWDPDLSDTMKDAINLDDDEDGDDRSAPLPVVF